MNQNNSSSAYTDEFISLDDYQEANYGKDLQKLKCENFQLRLMCYNYENTLSELECNPNDDNEVVILKKSYCKKVEIVNNLEETVKRVQKDNSQLRNQLQEYLEINNSTIKSSKDDETQINLECLECKEIEKNNEKNLKKLTLQVKCLENVNMDLQSAVKDKPETSEFGCTADETLALPLKSLIDNETDGSSEMESEIFQSNPCKTINLKVIYEKAVKSLSKFLNYYTEGEMHMADLEKQIMTSFQLGSIDESVIDDKYKINLFKEGTPSWETKFLDDIMLTCQNKVIDDDISELISDDDLVVHVQHNIQPPIETPNILIIKSFIEKLNENSTEKKLMRKKIQYNQNWEKQLSKTTLAIIESNPFKGLSEEYDFHIEKVTDIMSTFTRLIPIMQSTFTKTLARLTSAECSSINHNSDYYQNFIRENYEKNKPLFIDNCNLFIQVTSDCILLLNKEKMFLNHTREIFDSIKNEQVPNGNNLEKEIEDSTIFKQDLTNKSDNVTIYSLDKIISNKIDGNIHAKPNMDFFTSNGDNAIQIDVTDLEMENNDPTSLSDIDNTRHFEFLSNIYSTKLPSQPYSNTVNNNIQSLSNEANYCVFINKSLTYHNSETQTNYSEFNNQSKNLNKIKANKLEININLCDMEKTRIITNSENDELDPESQDLIAYSNQSNRTYNAADRKKLPKYDHYINEYLSKQNKDGVNRSLRRCFSLGSGIQSNHSSLLDTEFRSFQNINLNNRIPLNFSEHLDQLLSHCNSDDTSVTINSLQKNEKHQPELNISSIFDIRKDLHKNKKEMFFTKTDFVETFGTLSLFKLRIIKLLFIHDLRRNLSSISKKDEYVTTELTKIMNFVTFKSKASFNDSELLSNIRNSTDQWRAHIESFKHYINETVGIPEILLKISDEKIIELSFSHGESNLDFPLKVCGKSSTNTELYNHMESLIERMNQEYFSMNRIYFNIIETKQQILFQFTDDFQRLTKELENTLQLKSLQLEAENEKLKYQFQASLLEKEKLESQYDNIKTRNKQKLKDLGEEKENLRLELEKITQEKLELKNWIDNTVSEEKDRESKYKQDYQEKAKEINELKNRFNDILDQNRMLHEKIKAFESEVDSQNEDKDQLNVIINNNKSQLSKLNLKCQELEEEITNLREHEIQLLINNNRLEKSNEGKAVEVENLRAEIEIYKTKIIEYNNQMTLSERNYANKIEESDLIIAQTKRESILIKEKMFLLNEENNRLNVDVNSEKEKLEEVNEKYRLILEQFETYKFTQHSIKEEQHEQIKEFDKNKQLIRELHTKINKFIDTVIDLLLTINSKKNRKRLDNEIRASFNFNEDDSDDLKNLKSIDDKMDILVNIVRKEIEKSRMRSEDIYYFKNEKCNLLDNGDLNNIVTFKNDLSRKKCRYVVKRKSKHDNASTPYLNNYEIINDMNEKNMKTKSELSRKRIPIPTPRYCSNQLKEAFNLYHDNTNNSELENEETMSVISESSMSFHLESNLDDDVERSEVSNEKFDTSQFSGRITFHNDVSNNNSENSVEHFRKNKQNIVETLQSFLSLLNNEANVNVNSKFDRKILEELKHIVKSIDMKVENQLVNYSEPPSCELTEDESRNIKNLLIANRDLTDNLIKATNQIIEVQMKLEQVNSELCQCQMMKHEMSIELAAKCEKVSKLQNMLNKNQKQSKSKYITQMTQTNIPNNRNTHQKSLKSQEDDNDSNYGNVTEKPQKHSKVIDETETKSTRSTFTNCSDAQIQLLSSDNGKSNSLIKINVDGDWDDVTRTMIRCLTTLSEVQESLITPPLDKEIASPIPESVLLSNIHYNRDVEDFPEFNQTNYESKTIAIAYVKEKKLHLIRQLISDIKNDLMDAYSPQVGIGNRNKVLNIEMLKKSAKKLSYILHNCFKVSKLTLEQWLVLTGKSESRQANKWLEAPDTGINPVSITNKVQIDMMRLQKRLERYQNRYRSLKQAVMTNKCKLIDQSHYNSNGYED